MCRLCNWRVQAQIGPRNHAEHRRHEDGVDDDDDADASNDGNREIPARALQFLGDRRDLRVTEKRDKHERRRREDRTGTEGCEAILASERRVIKREKARHGERGEDREQYKDDDVLDAAGFLGPT